MSDAAGLFNLLVPFFALIGLGIVVARRTRLPEGGYAGMQVFLVHLALPALFFRLIAAKPIAELANWRFIAITTGATATAFAVSYAIAHRARLAPTDAVMAALAGSYSNVGYMGPPLVLSLLGPVASAPVALIFVFDTVLLFTLVPVLMTSVGGERLNGPALALLVLRRVFLHPFVIATLVGLAASLLAWSPPPVLDTLIGWLSAASAPLALFLLGVTVALRPVGRFPADVGALTGVKLLGHPLLVYGLLCLAGGFEPAWIKAATVMAALPPALNVFVLARQYSAGLDRASACILAGTLASTVTLTAWIWLVATGRLPVPAP